LRRPTNCRNRCQGPGFGCSIGREYFFRARVLASAPGVRERRNASGSVHRVTALTQALGGFDETGSVPPGERCSPRCGVLGRTRIYGYGRSLRPCLAASSGTPSTRPVPSNPPRWRTRPRTCPRDGRSRADRGDSAHRPRRRNGRCRDSRDLSLPDEEACYRFYLDDAGDVVADTCHASVEDALDQAALEYDGLSWIDGASD
jgi:hypothetical protein